MLDARHRSLNTLSQNFTDWGKQPSKADCNNHLNFIRYLLYGCESWSLTLREECRLRVFENRVLRRIFGPERDEVTGE
jgi:hypothetical protein